MQRSNTVKQLEEASAAVRKSVGRKASLPGLAQLGRTTKAMLDQADARVRARKAGEDTEGAELETGMSNQQLLEQLQSLAGQWTRA
ncbi:hypothetical protein CJO94_04880 [Ralstonia solanacearum]|nr:hypothetical protein CJO94_04880 [Ralstonia solanacearum]